MNVEYRAYVCTGSCIRENVNVFNSFISLLFFVAKSLLMCFFTGKWIRFVLYKTYIYTWCESISYCGLLQAIPCFKMKLFWWHLYSIPLPYNVITSGSLNDNCAITEHNILMVMSMVATITQIICWIPFRACRVHILQAINLHDCRWYSHFN